MQMFIRRHHVLATIGIVLLLGVVVGLFTLATQKPPPPITATVETGSVRQLVSVSGISEAKQSAELAFPVTGTVETVHVKIGDVVEAGTPLATLKNDATLSDRLSALAARSSAVAERDELIYGPDESDRRVTEETVRLKEAALKTTIATENSKVENALRALRSSSLSAYSDDPSEDAVVPTISGTFLCEKTGTYVIDVYASGGPSGYSFRLSGLENGLYTASVDQPSSLGTCGLRILFDPASHYSSTRWFVEIPNTKATSYTTSLNAYNLAVTQAESAIALAERELELARANATNANAPARSEAVVRADAGVAQADAGVARIEAELSDRTLIAPFSGTITELSLTAGETVGLEPVMTLLSSNEFEIKARVPEIDVGKLQVGQRVDMLFDAKNDTIVHGSITFISLKATLIDGVSYYEAYIQPDSIEPWMRSGLNADIDIIFAEAEAALRIPKRFLIRDAAGTHVLRHTASGSESVTVGVTLEGSDGFVAVTGLNPGDTVVAP